MRAGRLVRMAARDAMHGALFDLMASPFSLGIGLLIGLQVGRWRWRALQAVVSQATKKSFFTQLSIICRAPEDQKARRIERIAYLALISLWIVLIPFELRGVILPFATSSIYVFGLYLTGSLIPFIRLGFQSSAAIQFLPAAIEPLRQSDLGQSISTSGQKIHLRGAFNPVAQAIWGIVATVTVAGAALLATRVDDSGIDPYLSPVGLVIGLAVGYPLGVKRLHVLYKVLPGLDGRFIFTQWDVMMSIPEGALVTKAQGWILAIAFLGAIGIPALTNGKVSLAGSFALFGLGAFLTGKTLPFIRIWSELRSGNRRGGPSR
jgi:hypothetical protein